MHTFCPQLTGMRPSRFCYGFLDWLDDLPKDKKEEKGRQQWQQLQHLPKDSPPAPYHEVALFAKCVRVNGEPLQRTRLGERWRDPERKRPTTDLLVCEGRWREISASRWLLRA